MRAAEVDGIGISHGAAVLKLRTDPMRVCTIYLGVAPPQKVIRAQVL
jgi:hypothetical protein